MPPAVEAAPYLLVIAVLVAAAAAVLSRLRRQSPSCPPAQGASGGAGFTIDRLEDLWARGEISDEEFATLRREALRLDTNGRDADRRSSTPAKDDDGTRGEQKAGV